MGVYPVWGTGEEDGPCSDTVLSVMKIHPVAEKGEGEQKLKNEMSILHSLFS